MINKDNFPKTLLSLRQWLDWREERCPKAHRLVKVPYSPHSGYPSDATSPKTWGTVDEALAGVEKYKLHGIGFAFTVKNGILAIDLDDCIINGQNNEMATGFFSRAPRTYVELSPSGKGYHVLLYGKLPPEAGKGKRNSKNGVEMYSSSRYFTMTAVRKINIKEKACPFG